MAKYQGKYATDSQTRASREAQRQTEKLQAADTQASAQPASAPADTVPETAPAAVSTRTAPTASRRTRTAASSSRRPRAAASSGSSRASSGSASGNRRRKKKESAFSRFAFIPVFAVTLIYLEALYRIMTGGSLLSAGFFYTILFSIAYSGIGYLLSSISRKRKVNRIVAFVLLLLTCLVYIVMYLTVKQFKNFYDLNTMFGGAAGALTDYFSELLSLIFLQGGIFAIILMFLPAFGFLFLSKKWIPARPANAGIRILTAIVCVVTYLLVLIMVLLHPVYSLSYDEQYNFPSAVSNFGLLTGIRLDIKNMLFPKEISFENIDPPVLPPVTDDPTEPDPTSPSGDPTDSTDPSEEATEPPIVYGYNQVDIDFDALNKTASKAEKKLNDYVSSLTPSKQNAYTGMFKGKNLILITAEAFSAEVIDEELTPTLYRLATKGIQFTDYYQPASAGTTGGEYQNIFGMLPMDGGKSFKNTVKHLNYYTMGSQLDRLGYYGKAFHNNSHTFYDRNKTHTHIGYSDGFMGYGNGMEEYVKKAWPQSDLEMIAGTLPTYIDKQPFNIYYMTVSGHNNYTKSSNSMTKKNWDRVQHLPYSDEVKGYIAANLELEDALTHLVNELEAAGIADDTVICLSTDHFPYGLDSDAGLGNMPLLSELYGYDVVNYFQRDHSALILWCGSLEDQEPIVVDSPTFSLDILPTLSNLFGTEFDSRLMPGRDVFSDAEALVFNTNYDWKTDLGTYYASSGKFVPANEDIEVPDGYVDYMKSVVKNKITYCSGTLDTDYLRHIFED